MANKAQDHDSKCPNVESGEGQSWCFQTRLEDFQFAALHPDIALALFPRGPLALARMADEIYRGQLSDLQIEWQMLSVNQAEGGRWSLLVSLSTRVPPLAATWQLDLSAQAEGSNLLVRARLRPLGNSWVALWHRPSQGLWREALYALAFSLGRAAERLSHDSPQDLLRLLHLPEQQEELRGHLKSRPSAPRYVAWEGSHSTTLLSILEAGNRVLIRFQTNVPRPRRGQETVHVRPEARAESLGAFERIAQAGSAFFTLRGADERRALGRDLHGRLIELGRKLYALYVPKETHGYLTSLLDAQAQAPLRIESEGELRALPWELLHNGEDFLSLLLPLARSPLQAIEAQARIGPVRRVLLIVPQSELGEAMAEAEAIQQVLAEELSLDAEILSGRAASKEGVVQALREGVFDVLHYSGHSCHDPQQAGASHLVLNDGRKLRADELRRLVQECSLKFVFLNSCGSGSVGSSSSAALAGLADAFVQNGIPCVIAMRWPVSDHGARTLARTFYQELAKTGNPALALRQARLAVGSALDWEDPAWAAPLLHLA